MFATQVIDPHRQSDVGLHAVCVESGKPDVRETHTHAYHGCSGVG
jgi:hypothetical protein